jgi:hypothetical protein
MHIVLKKITPSQVKVEYDNAREKENSQDFHLGSIHPPYVGVENQEVNFLPVGTML